MSLITPSPFHLFIRLSLPQLADRCAQILGVGRFELYAFAGARMNNLQLEGVQCQALNQSTLLTIAVDVASSR